MDMRKILLTLLATGLLTSLSQGAIGGGSHHYRYYGGHYGGHYGHNDGATLAVGLIIGGVFGYLINEDRHHYRSHSGGHYRSEHYPHRHSTLVYERTEQTPTPITTTRNSEFSGHDCLMTREYTTTIIIDGVNKEAYGRRCMTADGSWVLGPPKFAPDL